MKWRALSDWRGIYGCAAAGVDGRDECGRRPSEEEKRRRTTNATVWEYQYIATDRGVVVLENLLAKGKRMRMVVAVQLRWLDREQLPAEILTSGGLENAANEGRLKVERCQQ